MADRRSCVDACAHVFWTHRISNVDIATIDGNCTIGFATIDGNCTINLSYAILIILRCAGCGAGPVGKEI